MVQVMVQIRKKFWMSIDLVKKMKMVKLNVVKVWFLLMASVKKFANLVSLTIMENVEKLVQLKLMLFWKEDVLSTVHKIGQLKMVSVLPTVVLEEQRLALLEISTLT